MSLRLTAFLISFLLASLAQAANFYETLGVSPEAAQEEIKTAWKSLVRAHHPDRFMNDPDAARAATEKLALINAAESVLGKPDLRFYYDHLSAQGRNHARWESFPGNTNPDILAKRLGSIDFLRSRQAAPQKPAPQTKSGPQAEPSPAPESADFTQVFDFFADPSVTDQDWKEVFELYLKKVPRETDANRQARLIQILGLPLADWKIDAISRALALKFEVSDARIHAHLWSLIRSEQASQRKAGVSLLFQILVNERSDLLRITSSEAKALLLLQMKDPSEAVRLHARKAAAHFDFSAEAQTPPDVMTAIRQLSASDPKLQNEAYQFLLKSPQALDEAALRALVMEIQKRQLAYRRSPSRKILNELSGIFKILSPSAKLSLIAKDLRELRNAGLPREIEAQAKAVTDKASFEPASSWLLRCHQVFR